MGGGREVNSVGLSTLALTVDEMATVRHHMEG
jgi:hypothetical protein